jgi:hypothetical protein
MEPLLNGKAKYHLPPCINLFSVDTSIYVFYKTSYLNEEVNRTEPSPLVSVPWFITAHANIRLGWT